MVNKAEKYLAWRDAYDEFDPKVFFEMFHNETYTIKNKMEVNPYTLYYPPAKNENYDPKAVLTYDKYGLRTPYLSVPKTTNSYRICMLGGSTVWGSYAMRNEMTIPTLLERRLNEAYGSKRHFQVVNCGVGGFVATQELIFMQLAVLKNYAPDMVIFYDGINDFFSAQRNDVTGYPIMWKMYFEMMNRFVKQRYFALLVRIICQSMAENKVVSILRSRIIKHIKRTKLREEKNNEGQDPKPYEPYIKAAKHYYFIHEIAHNLLKNMGIKCISILQPVLLYGQKKFTSFEQKIYEEWVAYYGNRHKECLKIFYDNIKYLFEQNRATTSWHNFSHRFDNIEESIFLDQAHTGDRGAKIIAGHIAAIILDNISIKGNKK